MQKIYRMIGFAVAAAMVGGAFANAVSQDDTIITFSTKGDTYVDGSTVLKGEWYALCWSADANFAGITADCKAADPYDSETNPAGDAVIACLPNADGQGNCVNTIVIIKSASRYAHTGYYFIYLLDTRNADGTAVAPGVDGKPTSVNGTTVVVNGAAASAEGYNNISAPAVVTSADYDETALPADATDPVISKINPAGEAVEITVENMHKAVKYNIRKGSALGNVMTLHPDHPLTGVTETVFSLPKDDARFFQVVRQPLKVEGESAN